jgi:colanic acid biosynthesis glycosyl transferase WcaI
VKPRLRVTILGLNYIPEPTGNAPYTTHLARKLVREGTEVCVITGFPHYPQWERYAGYSGWRSISDDHGVRLVRLAHWIARPPRGVRRLLSEVTFGLRLITTRWFDPQITVLVSPALFSSAIAMLRSRLYTKSSRIVWAQDLYSQGMTETGEGSGLAVRIATAVERWTLTSADAVVAIHPSMARRMTDQLGVAADRVRVIPNWSHVTMNEINRATVRARLGWHDDDYIVLHAGNIGRKQGLENVVNAAHSAAQASSQVRFVVLGDGAERTRLEASAAGCNNIAFVDPLPDDQFTDALQAADALLVNELPGVKEMAVPSKITSYFAAGRPVVAAVEPHGIVADIMRQASAGPIVQGGDPAALLAACDSLSRDPASATSGALGARAYFLEHLSAEAAFTAWAELLNSFAPRESRSPI